MDVLKSSNHVNQVQSNLANWESMLHFFVFVLGNHKITKTTLRIPFLDKINMILLEIVDYFVEPDNIGMF
jgi:hypothetical protein